MDLFVTLSGASQERDREFSPIISECPAPMSWALGWSSSAAGYQERDEGTGLSPALYGVGEFNCG